MFSSNVCLKNQTHLDKNELFQSITIARGKQSRGHLKPIKLCLKPGFEGFISGDKLLWNV